MFEVITITTHDDKLSYTGCKERIQRERLCLITIIIIPDSQFTMNILCIVYWLIRLSQHAILDTKRVKGPCERSVQEVGHAGP